MLPSNLTAETALLLRAVHADLGRPSSPPAAPLDCAMVLLRAFDDSRVHIVVSPPNPVDAILDACGLDDNVTVDRMVDRARAGSTHDMGAE